MHKGVAIFMKQCRYSCSDRRSEKKDWRCISGRIPRLKQVPHRGETLCQERSIERLDVGGGAFKWMGSTLQELLCRIVTIPRLLMC